MRRSQMVMCLLVVALLCLGLSLPCYAGETTALITADELQGVIGQDGVVVVDVRAADLYAQGHIPGAVSVQTSEFYEDRDGVKQMAAGPEKFAALLGRIGVSADTKVVVYSAANDLKHAARLWWVLHMYGHQDAQLLNGGLDAWVGAGFETSTAPVSPTPSVYTLGVVDETTVATMDEVKAALNGGTVVVDCRDDAYFAGEKAKAARSGHIAGAILIAEKDNLNADGTFKSVADLEKLYAAQGVTADTPVITYCNTGTIASIQYFALTQILGYDKVQNFDASLTGWAADPALPMESDYDYYTLGKNTAEINAAFVDLPVAPFAVAGRTFVPAEALAAGLNATCTATDQALTFKAGEKTAVLTVGKTGITVNGQTQQMDAAPVTENGAVCVPLRAVSEAFGFDVTWDGAKNLVTVGPAL